MATNFTLKREKAVHETPKVYEMVREHKAENQKIMALAKELHKHERTVLILLTTRKWPDKVPISALTEAGHSFAI